MKRLIILMCTVSTLMVAQDAAGQYKLSGVNVLYTYIVRTADYDLTVTDAYGFGITQIVATIPQGAPFLTQSMQLTDAALSAIGINLNVTLNADGSGLIAEGSFYPDVNTITDADGNCVTLQQVLPVTDAFTFTSMNNMMEYVGMAHPGVNVLGLPGISNLAGQQLGGLGLSNSVTFEDYPMFPSHPTLCDPDGFHCQPFTVGDIDQSGAIEFACGDLDGDGVDDCPTNMLGIHEYIPGGLPLTGLSAGYFLDDQCDDAGGNCNATDLASVYPGNIDPDFILEWHGVDGASSGLGSGDEDEFGNEIGDDDGDGTWWDRLLGLPGLTATYLNPACGFTQPIYGDVSGLFPAECVTSVGLASSGYLMDPSGSLATWGNFLTAHGAIFQLCAGTYGEATCAGMAGGVLLADDSGVDMDPACLSDYNPADLTTILDCSGRLTMNFNIPCLPIIEAREVVAEFIEVGGCGGEPGDLTGDGVYNVLDVVQLVNCVLAQNCSELPNACAGDMNADGIYNVLDVVNLVNCVLAANCGGGRVDDASSAEINVIGNEVTMTADGIVGGVQMTLSHGNDFALTLTDGGQFSDYLTEGNTTTLIIVNPTGTSLFTAEGNFTIESVIASNYQGNSKLNISINMPKEYSIGSAYPNPFNPTTQMTLDLNTDAIVSVKVFNTMGQLIDVIAEGQMSSGSYNLTWDGTNAASGVYFIQTEISAEVHSQKIMLIK